MHNAPNFAGEMSPFEDPALNTQVQQSLHCEINFKMIAMTSLTGFLARTRNEGCWNAVDLVFVRHLFTFDETS